MLQVLQFLFQLFIVHSIVASKKLNLKFKQQVCNIFLVVLTRSDTVGEKHSAQIRMAAFRSAKSFFSKQTDGTNKGIVLRSSSPVIITSPIQSPLSCHGKDILMNRFNCVLFLSILTDNEKLQVNPLLIVRGLSCPRSAQMSFSLNCLKLVLVVTLAFKKAQVQYSMLPLGPSYLQLEPILLVHSYRASTL